MSARLRVLSLMVWLCTVIVTGVLSLCVSSAIAADPDAEPVMRDNDMDEAGLIDDFVSESVPPDYMVTIVRLGSGADPVKRVYSSVEHAETDGSETFEWGRCSDLIIWACVMRLAEDGLLDIEAPLEDILPDPSILPDGYGALTIINLMDHTTGLDVAMIGSRSSIGPEATSTTSVLPLFDVKAYREPSDVVAYTPYDVVLAATVIEAVTGEDICSYVQREVFDRLGMSSARISLGDDAIKTSPNANVRRLGFVQGIADVGSGFMPEASSGSVFSCIGTAEDLFMFACCLMGESSPITGETLLSEEASASMFSVTRTYPGIGIPRVAHGMFAFPLSTGVYGMSASTSTGYSSSVYMSKFTGFVSVVLVDEAGRADLTQGITRLLVGRLDYLSTLYVDPRSSTWIGTYQDSSRPEHGPAKLLTALTRTNVSLDDRGVLTFDGITASPLGSAVYSLDTANDQDVYRFHVSLEHGSGFSRATSDSYVVATSQLVVEWVLIVLGVFGLVVSAAYTLLGLVSAVRRTFVRTPVKTQSPLVVLSAATLVAGVLALLMTVAMGYGVAPYAVRVWLVLELVAVITGVIAIVWVFAAARGGLRLTTQQKVARTLVLIAFVSVTMNLVYWEMLP